MKIIIDKYRVLSMSILSILKINDGIKVNKKAAIPIRVK